MRSSLGRRLACGTALALVASSWVGVSAAASDSPAAAAGPADPCAVTSVEAEPAECVPEVSRSAGDLAGPGQTVVPVLPGAAFADGLGTVTDKLTHPTGNMSDPAVLLVEGAGISMYGYDFSPDGSVLYGLDANVSGLVTINQETGASTPVGPMTLHAGHTWTDLTIDPLLGTAYAMSTNAVDTTVYSVNLSTGAATELGTTTGITNAIDASMNCAGQMYATSIANDTLYAVNPTTVTFTPVGPLGYSIAFAQGIDFDNATGVLHAWLYQGGGVSQYSSVNLATGAATAFPAGDIDGEFEGAIRTTCDAPAAAIVSAPAARTPNLRPDLGFQASGGTVQCSLDRVVPEWGGCTTATSFRPTTNLGAGAWTFRVRSTQRSLTALDTRSFTVVDCRALAVAAEKGKAKVAKAKAALKKAKLSGNAAAIAKAKKKLKKAKKALKNAKSALAAELVC